MNIYYPCASACTYIMICIMYIFSVCTYNVYVYHCITYIHNMYMSDMPPPNKWGYDPGPYVCFDVGYTYLHTYMNICTAAHSPHLLLNIVHSAYYIRPIQNQFILFMYLKVEDWSIWIYVLQLYCNCTNNIYIIQYAIHITRILLSSIHDKYIKTWRLKSAWRRTKMFTFICMSA